MKSGHAGMESISGRTVDDEDVCAAGGNVRDIQEVNVVLGQGHHWVVTVRVR